MGDQPPDHHRRTGDQRPAVGGSQCHPLPPHPCPRLQHGPAVDGRGPHAQVTRGQLARSGGCVCRCCDITCRVSVVTSLAVSVL